LLAAVAAFVRTARDYPGVLRIALLGSLATDKPIPKDADVLVTIEGSMDLTKLARAGRQLKGATNSINLSADIFLAEEAGRYLVESAPIANAICGCCAMPNTAASASISTTTCRCSRCRMS
jgi:hypothetical protein